MTSGSIDDDDIDEALWVAYRSYDKSAVTENLLRRYLPGVTFIPNLRADCDAVRESGGHEATSDGSIFMQPGEDWVWRELDEVMFS
jgi:hypothetical protein